MHGAPGTFGGETESGQRRLRAPWGSGPHAAARSPVVLGSPLEAATDGIDLEIVASDWNTAQGALTLNAYWKGLWTKVELTD